jgi:hypothetical protein
MPIDRKSKLWIGPSHSEDYFNNRSDIPQVSALMAKSVSEERRQIISEEIAKGYFREGSPNQHFNDGGLTANGLVTSSAGMKKFGQISGSGGHMFHGVHGDSVKQTPEVYSPLWLNSNLNLPRDRATINAWCRSFFTLNPFVHNAICLHSTYPISKLSIKCPNKDIEKFFNDMIEEIDLMNICVQIAQEFWLLGEAFVYAELDESRGRWSRLMIQNPDYMIVKRTVVANEPIIMLRPDENLKKIIFSNRPTDIEQRKQLNNHIIDSVKRGENIPLDNYHVSHLARRISPYEIRGTGLPVCIFRQLMLFDKLRESKYAQADNMINPLTLVKIGSADYKPTFADLESWREVFECHDEETEVLTSEGFKKFNEVISFSEVMDGTYNTSYITNIQPVAGVKIACFNSKNEQLEYHEPTGASLYNYCGNMYHFMNKKMDIKVTPNHKMWVSKRGTGSKYGDWHKVKAQDLSITNYHKFRACVKWDGEVIETVKVCGKEVPIAVYLEFLGYLLSEGSVYKSTNQKYYYTTICQSIITEKRYYPQMKKCLEDFAKYLGMCHHSSISKNGMWGGSLRYQELYLYFKKEIGTNDNTKSAFKKVPRWVLNLSPKLLKILLDALVMGDGSLYESRVKGLKYSKYTTISKQLADDVFEIALKCGYSPMIATSWRNEKSVYNISWSTDQNNGGKGFFPVVHNGTDSRNKHVLQIEKYNGKVWCFEVPTGLFITRRRGKITIQGNSAQYDKDFKIFTHEGVAVERVGYGQGIYDISGDITQIIKEIYVGLQVPPVLMDGGADTTYANGGVALDVLRQRYMQFRNMMGQWLKRKIFAPISKMQGFYDYSGGEKQLIVPEIDWNHMSLFDTSDYIQSLLTLTQGDGAAKRASLHTLHRAMGLEYEDEQRKIRREAIQDSINKKEKAALDAMDLNALRALDDEDEITEVEGDQAQQGEPPLPGETPGGGGSASSIPGLDLGPPPSPGGAPPAPPGGTAPAPVPEAPPAPAPPAK